MQRKRLRIVTLKYIGLTEEERDKIHTPDTAASFFSRLIGESDRENFAVLHLDARNHALSCEIVTTGTLTNSLVHPREVFKAAFMLNASSIIVAHNHPSGDITPSSEDLSVSRRLRSAAEILGINVLDFLIVSSDGSFWSQSSTTIT